MKLLRMFNKVNAMVLSSLIGTFPIIITCIILPFSYCFVCKNCFTLLVV